MGHSHEYHHEIKEISPKKIFMVVLFNAVIKITEIIGGIVSGSLALVSDSILNLRKLFSNHS